MDVLPLLDRAYRETIEVAAKVQLSDLERPTPCTEWDVRALVNHFLWASERLSGATAGLPGPERGADMIGGDVGKSVETVLERALDRWRSPGALEASCELEIGTVPGQLAATISLVDLYTHRWDLARAVGGDTELDPELAEAALAASRGIVNEDIRSQVGFAPPVPVGPDASPTDRLVAFLGRRP